MRGRIQPQLALVDQPIKHEHARELGVMSALLDDHAEIVELVFADLVPAGVAADNGREGMSAEQVLRSLIVRHIGGFTLDDLAFQLEDSSTYRRFCRFGIGDKGPSSSALQRDFKRISPETLEAINRLLIRRAEREGLEQGDKIRVDCTVEQTNIHHPTDSSLLRDCVRVLARLMTQARQLTGTRFVNHSRSAKRTDRRIDDAKCNRQRRKLYRRLLKLTRQSVEDAERVARGLDRHEAADALQNAVAMGLAKQIRQYVGLAKRVVRQTERRVLDGDKVPAADKIVSIFEPHTDIIIKGNRETEFGHKLCLSAGASGLVFDCIVLDGNPADSTLAVDMVQRHIELMERPPRQAAFDGGFASKKNLSDIKALGVKDVMFHKRRGLAVAEMVKSTWVYRRLKNFRAGIEGIISFLKRSLGLRRCPMRSLPSFKAHTWAGIVSANLLLIARHLLL